MIKQLSTLDQDFEPQFEKLVARDASVDPEITRRAEAIVQDVAARGDEAVIEYTNRFDHLNLKTMEDAIVTREEMLQALETLPADQKQALETAAKRIREFHEHQLEKGWTITDSYGSVLGQRITAIDSVGLYVPGGKAAYPSSVLMNAMPAHVAGVPRIEMVFPTPGGERNLLVLAAAALAGVSRAFTIGGAQAVAALAYGTKTLDPVDKIVGPGNAYVAAAKRYVFGRVGIDMIAGPSEILVICDGKTPADWIAMDLFSQAEHDELASAILITTSQELAEKVSEEVDGFLKVLSRSDIISKSLDNFGYILVTDSHQEAIDTVDAIAPEHLEIVTKNPFEDMMKVHNAGAIFLGENSSEPLGDYFAGPNHILPTNGTAKFFSPLSVDDFVKKSSIIYYSREALSEIHEDIESFAKSESLTAHANSIAVRFEGEE